MIRALGVWLAGVDDLSLKAKKKARYWEHWIVSAGLLWRPSAGCRTGEVVQGFWVFPRNDLKLPNERLTCVIRFHIFCAYKRSKTSSILSLSIPFRLCPPLLLQYLLYLAIVVVMLLDKNGHGAD